MIQKNEPNHDDQILTFRSFLLGLIFSAAFAVMTVKGELDWRVYTVTQIPVLPYVLLFVSVAALNPLLRLTRLSRALSPSELMVIFVMGMVSAGVSSLGMASQLVPRVSGLFNQNWNQDQSRWDIYIEPYVNDDYFVAEEGTREAAIRLRDADEIWRDTQSVYRAARSLLSSQDQLAEARKELDEAGQILDEKKRLLKEREARHRFVMAGMTLEKAEKWWKRYSDDYDPTDVVETFPDTIEEMRLETERLKTELDGIEAPAFKKMALFRKGMPAEMRAIPGFIYVEGEGIESYRSRVKRLIDGTAAFKELFLADEMLTEALETGGDVRDEVSGHLRLAVETLAPISKGEELKALKQELDKKVNEHKNLVVEQEQITKLVHRWRRYAHADEFDALDERRKAGQEAVAELKTKIAELEKERDTRVVLHLAINERVERTKKAIEDLLVRVQAGTPADYIGIKEDLSAQMESFSYFDASFRRFLVGDVEWRIWIRPLLNWSVIILTTYVVLMAFNVLIFRQWAHNEKLIYPLAELPMVLAGAEEDSTVATPAVWRSGLFWTGVSIPILILGWNVYVQKYVPGTRPINQEWGGYQYLDGSFLDALKINAKFHVFFTLIGLTFLIPARISYSLWSFHFVYMIQLLVIVAFGYGVNEWSFPEDRHMVMNFRSAEGGGALIVFAAVVIWKARKYIFCCLMPDAISGLEQGEQTELKISSWVFIFGSVALVALMNLGLGASLFYSTLYYLIIMVIVIGLTRAVAEGGLLTFKCFFGPFHFIRSVFGMNHAWSAPSLLAPLFVFNSVLFMQYKTIIAPAMANALKIRDKLGLSRLKFHVAVASGIMCAFVVGLVAHVIVNQHHGADKSDWWFYTAVPQNVFNTIKSMAMTNPVDSGGGKWWLLTGAVVMALLLYSRRHAFWLPHPIGLIMFVNPVMHTFWFSILIGWIFKVLVSKYGSKDTYSRFRFFFIGLIVGELIMCFIAPPWAVIDLNRN